MSVDDQRRRESLEQAHALGSVGGCQRFMTHAVERTQQHLP
jgi:hypothetical protein